MQKVKKITTVDHSQEITQIKANHHVFHLNAKELWNYKDLIRLFVQRNFVVQYKQTVLGPIWLLLGPLITTVMYTIVFGQFAGMGTDGIPTFLFYMAGTNLWTLFNTAVMNTSNTFVANSSVFGKVYFPRLTVPISQVITSLINFLLQLIIFFLFMLGNSALGGEFYFHPRMLLVIPLIFQTMLFGLAVGLIVTSLTTRFRDLAVAITFCMQLWMYASPIIYPLSRTGGVMRLALLMNPITAMANNYRFALFGIGEFLTWNWLYAAAMTALMLVWGIVLYNKIERTFMDTV